MKPFTFVTAIHGNETLPTLALASVGEGQVVGNIRAIPLQKRFVEKDLNASFGSDGHSYEEQRARELLLQIPQDVPVVDFHTFLAESEPFVVIVDLNFVPLAQQTGITNIVFMKHNIKGGHALINHRPGISVEVGQHTDLLSFERTLQVRENLLSLQPKRLPITLYEVYDTIKTPGEYKNFSLYHQGNESFFPVLAGKNSYEFYGLKARILQHTESTL